MPSLAALNGTASGGGYELAIACDEIVLVDDGSSAVSLPEAPLLGVLPGTGGLTRLVDKRKIRRDLADVVLDHRRGRARQARGRVGPRRRGAAEGRVRRGGRSGASTRWSRARSASVRAVALAPLEAKRSDTVEYEVRHRRARRAARTATLTVRAPERQRAGDARRAREGGRERVGAPRLPRARRRAPRSALQPARRSASSR